MDETRTDVAVVGAGPIGLEMAVALKRAGVDYVQFDARQIGYTISWFAPQTRFFSSNERIAIAGVPLQTPDQNKCTREQYLSYLRSVALEFDLRVRTYEPVVGIERVGDEFQLTTEPRSGRRRCRARRLVLCTGGTDRPRRLDIPGEDLPHVSHYFQDPHTYFGKRLLIVGGKNSAIEAALRCHQAGARVSLSYRRERLDPKSIKYWLLPEINGLLESGRMDGHFNTVPAEITPTQVRLRETDAGTTGRDAETRGQEDAGTDADGDSALPASGPPLVSASPCLRVPASSMVPADFVLLLIGYEQDPTLLKLAGVEMQGTCHTPVYDERTMETNVPGLYVAGTAVGGTQDKYQVFIENCHIHVERITAALLGAPAPAAPQPLASPES